MIRKLAFAGAVFVLVAGLAIVIAGLFLNRLLAANRDALLARVETVLGRRLQVAAVTVSWGIGLGVRLTQVEVGEDPDFGREPFVQADEVTAHLRLMPLLGRRLEIDGVTLTRPTVRIERNADGRRNYESLGRQQRAARTDLLRRVAATGDSDADVAAEHRAAPFALQINSLSLRDGTVAAIDRAQSPPLDATVRHVDLTLHGLTRVSPIAFVLTAAALSDDQNLKLTGKIGPLSEIERVPLQLRGTVGPFPALHATLDHLDIHAVLTQTTVELQQLRGDALAGTFDLSGSCSLVPGGALHVVGWLRGISLAQLLAVRPQPSPVTIEGSASLHVDVNGPIAADPLRSLRGVVAADVTGGRLRDFNIARELLERVAGLPGLTQMLSGRVKPKYSRLFTTTDTRFEQARATLHLADGRATTDDVTLAAEDFAVHAAGWFDVDRTIDMTGSLLMSQRFSDDVVADVKEAKYVVDNNGQLAIPFRLHGTLGEAKPKPDERALGEMLDRALSRGAATDLLNKLLSGKRRRSTPAQANDGGDALEHKLRDLFGR